MMVGHVHILQATEVVTTMIAATAGEVMTVTMTTEIATVADAAGTTVNLTDML